MTDKQRTILEAIEQHFDDWFTLSQLKEFTEAAPATLTSLVKLGYLERSNGTINKVYQYRLLNVEIPEEEKLKREYVTKVNNADGLLTHLNNSLASWTKQSAEVGIEFPEAEYMAWYNKMNERVLKKKERILAEYKELTGQELFYEDSAF